MAVRREGIMHKLLIPLVMIVAITAVSWWLLYGLEPTPATSQGDRPVVTPSR